jgi:hypothetical protein
LTRVDLDHDQLYSARLTARLFQAPKSPRRFNVDSDLTGKVRLAKWFTTIAPKAKGKIVKDVTQLVLGRRTRMCNFLEYKGTLITAGGIQGSH